MSSLRALLWPTLACLILFALTRLHYVYWPFAWPDEALFSSPAAELARGAGFGTPVLKGLLPGMETATLWNSPLFMVVLGGLYYFLGESLATARSLSLFCAFLALFVFHATARRLFASGARADVGAWLAGGLTLLLACDPTFHRAANTGRMDMLTLLFLIAALFFLVRGALPAPDATQAAGPGAGRSPGAGRGPLFFLAGLCTGLAGLSHPAGILGVPVILIFAWPAPADRDGRAGSAGMTAYLPAARRLAAGAAGTLLGIAPWLFYILPNLKIFQIQFLSQVIRKQGMLEAAAGGDTGGVLVVFFSQYGASRTTMILAGIALALSLLAVVLRVLTLCAGPGRDARRRIALAFAAVTLLVILASEAWYPLYVGPFWLLALGLLLEDRAGATAPAWTGRLGSWLERMDGWRRPLGLACASFFLVVPIYFTVRHRLVLDTPAKVRAFESEVTAAAASCSSIYLRVRPDPYFRLREYYPNMEVLEFIPGKLQIGGHERFFRERYGVPDFAAYLERRFDRIDCFLLDDHGDWEPLLTAYLDRKLSEFSSTRITAAAPLEPATLWRRRSNN